MSPPAPRCCRCTQPIIGPRSPGAAALSSGGWACGYCATVDELADFLLAMLTWAGEPIAWAQ